LEKENEAEAERGSLMAEIRADSIGTETDVLDIYLPEFLRNDIDALVRGYENNSTLLDCLYCEVQGSINAAFYNGQITEREAAFLRRKYLGLELEDQGFGH
jgi:hypothetical protein